MTLPSTGPVTTTTSPILYVNAADAGAKIQDGSQAHPYGSIQAAVNAASSGDTIEVAAGTYAENVVVTTASLVIDGPNANINPTNTARVAEAIVEPGLSSSYNTSSVFTIEANNVTVAGFTIQGSIAKPGAGQSAGFALTSGVTTYAAAGVSNSTNVSTGGAAGSTVDVSGMVVQDNIVQDFTQVGIYGDTSDGAVSTGNTILDNRIADVPENGQGGFDGEGIIIYDNFYANVNYNGLSGVRTGIQTGNNYTSAGAFAPSITGNYVSAFVKGVYFNLQYENASAFTVSDNVITQANRSVSPAYNVGLLIQSIQGSVSATISSNDVSGFLYGVEFAGNDTTNTVTLQGGTLNANTYGIWVTNNDYFYPASYDTTAAVGHVAINNSTGAGIWVDSTSASSTGSTDTTDTVSLAFSGATLITGGAVGLLVDGSLAQITGDTLSNTAFRLQSGNYITLANGALAGSTLDATAASFDAGPGGTGVVGANVTRPEGFAIVNRITDAVSNPSLGLVRIKPNNIYVTTKTGSIQNGIEAAATGDIVNVNSGTYVVNGNFADSAAGVVYELNVDKSVTLLGPNAGYNPLMDAALPNPAAIIEPGTSDPNPSDSTAVTIVGVNASNVTIQGFTIVGNNPALANDSHTIRYNGVPIDASEGIASYSDVGNITITNNVVQHLAYAGIDFENGVNSGAATSDNVISENRLFNLGGGGFDYGIGVILYDNFYAQVTDNVMATVRVGAQTGNFSQANSDGSFTPEISSNSISAVRRGIFYNLAYSNASAFTVAHNTISAVADSSVTQWDGIMIASQQDAVAATFGANTINGSASTAATVAGYDVWNTPTTGTLMIEGGSVTGVSYGVWVNTYEGDGSNAGNTQVTVSGLAGTARTDGVYVEESPQNTSGATATATITGGPTVSTAGNGVGIDINGATGSASVDISTISGDFAGIRVENGGTLTAADSNNITNNQVGVQVTSGAATLTANRIVGNRVGVTSVGSNSTVTATDNWWGANGGPNALGSDRATSASGGSLDVSTWLVLSVTTSATPLSAGQTATITADLTHDNTGAAVTPTLPPATISFAATTGSISPHVSTLVNGTATAVFTAGTLDSQVGATVDNQKAITYVDVYPMVTGISIGTGTSGRTYFVVDFSQAVTLGAGAISLMNQTGTTPTLSVTTTDGGLTYVVRVSGSGTSNGALTKGTWTLTVHAQDVYDADGLSPVADVSKSFTVG